MAQPVRAFALGADQLALAVGTLGAAGLWVALNGDAALSSEHEGRRDQSGEPCPRCSGEGFEPCMCLRWSDGDAGCSTCRPHAGRMPCRSCRGGGTAIPVFQSVHKTNGDRGR